MKKPKKIVKKAKKLTKSVKKASPKKRVKKSASSREASEEKAVRKSLARIPINARRRAFNKNAAVTVIRNGEIVRVHPDKREEVIGTVNKEPFKGNIHKPIRIK